MNEQAIRLPIWTVTNPFLLWYYEHGGEDLGWGQTGVGQITIALAIHDLAGKIVEEELRNQIQQGAAKVVAKAGQRVMRESL